MAQKSCATEHRTEPDLNEVHFGVNSTGEDDAKDQTIERFLAR